MLILDWIMGMFSKRGKALFTYKRGMRRARDKDHHGAIKDYSDTINAAETPIDIQAMALYNRALEMVAIGEDVKGQNDLDAVLAMDNAPTEVKEMAKIRMIRLESKVRTRKGKPT